MNNANAHDAGGFKIDPAMPEWTRWLEFYRLSGMAKLEARMLAAIVDADRARRRWLNRLLLEILSSDCPLEDVEIQKHHGASPRTVIAIRGEAVHVFITEVSFVVPSAVPPPLPRAANLTPQKSELAEPEFKGERRSLGDGEFDAIVERLEKRAAASSEAVAEQKQRARRESVAERALAQALAAVLENRRPDVDDSLLGVIIVPDPAEADSLVLIGRGPPMRIKNASAKLRVRVTSLRDDPIGRLAKHKRLGEGQERDDRLLAARSWQALYERAEIGGARGLDPSKDIVDGGMFLMPETDARLEAHDRLKELRKAIGFIPELRILGARLLEWVLGEKRNLIRGEVRGLDDGLLMPVADILAAELALTPLEKTQLSLSKHLANCLDVVAVELGIVPNPKIKTGPRREVDNFDKLARYSRSSELYAAVNEARHLGAESPVIGGNEEKPTLRLDSE